MNNNVEQHILVVDDDKEIRGLLGRFLQKHGFATSTAQNGEEMEAILTKSSPDLIILDLMMPGDDGMTLCRRLREKSRIPIIMLTAISEDVDRILGLEMGADDYLSKPFNPRELLARARAILRRSQGNGVVVNEEVERSCFRFANWVLDSNSRRLTSPDQLEISLTSGEFALLIALLEHPQQVLSRDQLLDFTHNRPAAPFDRSIDIQISRLRAKLEEDQRNPQLIKTVRNGGYMLACEVLRV